MAQLKTKLSVIVLIFSFCSVVGYTNFGNYWAHKILNKLVMCMNNKCILFNIKNNEIFGYL